MTTKMSPRTLERHRMAEREKILARKVKRDAKAERRALEAAEDRKKLLEKLKPKVMVRPLCYSTQRDFPLGGGWLTPTELIVQLLFVLGFLSLLTWMLYLPILSRLIDVEAALADIGL